MKEDSTPRKVQVRYSELLDRGTKDFSSKKMRKIAKKSLNAAFTSLSEDVTESPKDPVDLSSVSEIADSDHIREISESFLNAANPVLSASSESLLSSDLTPSSTVTAEMDESGHQDGTFEPGGSKISYVEVETAINFLKRSRSQVLRSADTDPRSKRTMDALIEIVIGQFYPYPEGKDHYGKLILKKTQTVLLCFFLCILAVAVAFSFGSAVQNSFEGPLPT